MSSFRDRPRATGSSEAWGSLTGQLIRPGDPDYETARTVWNAMVDRRPAVVARPTTAVDVAQAVRFGRERGLEIGVKGGGHSVAGLAVPKGGLLIDLSLLGSVRVAADQQRAWVGGGARLGELDRASQAFGLATTAGNISHTGVGGLTLGGGMGWLARQFGLSCDNVESYEMVTADGSVVRTSESENADLFWGLRGGGGNFGVVTEFVFRLHPVGTRVLLAEFFYEVDAAGGAIRRWAEFLPSAPRQATLTAWAGQTPAGRPLASVGYVWVGDPDEGRRLLPTFREFGPAVNEKIAEMSYLKLQTMDDEPARYGLRRYWKGHYLRELSDGAIQAFLSVARSGAGLLHGNLQSYGGAIGEVGADETAFSQRDAVVEFVASTAWTDPAEDETEIAAARRYGAAVEPFASGVYINTLADEGDSGVRRAYRAEQLRRLADLKAHYDPDNVFHLNHNIAPASGRAHTA
ncbi:MAG: FAD-binding oxidoreductase [Chloroflexi bacterium]|nr:FAD-binding oxidoreductase [Chloroflexota bacterium]